MVPGRVFQVAWWNLQSASKNPKPMNNAHFGCQPDYHWDNYHWDNYHWETPPYSKQLPFDCGAPVPMERLSSNSVFRTTWWCTRQNAWWLRVQKLSVSPEFSKTAGRASPIGHSPSSKQLSLKPSLEQIDYHWGQIRTIIETIMHGLRQSQRVPA